MKTLEIKKPSEKILSQAQSLTDESKFSLEQLLAQVTKDNLHDEIDTGMATGREI